MTPVKDHYLLQRQQAKVRSKLASVERDLKEVAASPKGRNLFKVSLEELQASRDHLVQRLNKLATEMIQTNLARQKAYDRKQARTQRLQKAWRLRQAGQSYRQVGEALGVGEKRGRQLVLEAGRRLGFTEDQLVKRYNVWWRREGE